jgi:hypothetical protein
VSVEIPDGLKRYVQDFRAPLLLHRGRADDIEVVKTRDLPKLYEAWAESLEEDVARGLFEAGREESLENGTVPWPEWEQTHESSREVWRRRARKLLGLEERS